MIAGTPENNWLHQPTPTTNHVPWTMGHLATTYAWLCTLLDAKYKNTLPDSYNGHFAMGSKPSGDKKAYPAASEVRISDGEGPVTKRLRQLFRQIVTSDHVPED